MTITSPAFKNGEPIPRDYTCDGGNNRPTLQIRETPPDAKSFALILEDPDAPGGTFTHWIVWNIPAGTKELPAEKLPEEAVEGRTDFGSVKYGGPCPPSGHPHRYFFKLYALDDMLTLKAGASREELESEIEKRQLEKAELIGLYKR